MGRHNARKSKTAINFERPANAKGIGRGTKRHDKGAPRAAGAPTRPATASTGTGARRRSTLFFIRHAQKQQIKLCQFVTVWHGGITVLLDPSAAIADTYRPSVSGRCSFLAGPEYVHDERL